MKQKPGPYRPPGDFRSGDTVKVVGGNVLIGQTGRVVSDSRSYGPLLVLFPGYDKPRKMSAERLLLIQVKDHDPEIQTALAKALTALLHLTLAPQHHNEDEALTFEKEDQFKALEHKRKATAYWA